MHAHAVLFRPFFRTCMRSATLVYNFGIEIYHTLLNIDLWSRLLPIQDVHDTWESISVSNMLWRLKISSCLVKKARKSPWYIHYISMVMCDYRSTPSWCICSTRQNVVRSENERSYQLVNLTTEAETDCEPAARARASITKIWRLCVDQKKKSRDIPPFWRPVSYAIPRLNKKKLLSNANVSSACGRNS